MPLVERVVVHCGGGLVPGGAMLVRGVSFSLQSRCDRQRMAFCGEHIITLLQTQQLEALMRELMILKRQLSNIILVLTLQEATCTVSHKSLHQCKE